MGEVVRYVQQAERAGRTAGALIPLLIGGAGTLWREYQQHALATRPTHSTVTSSTTGAQWFSPINNSTTLTTQSNFNNTYNNAADQSVAVHPKKINGDYAPIGETYSGPGPIPRARYPRMFRSRRRVGRAYVRGRRTGRGRRNVGLYGRRFGTLRYLLFHVWHYCPVPRLSPLH